MTSSWLSALQAKTPPPAEKKKEKVDKPAAQANGKVGFSTGPVVCAGVSAQDLVMCMQRPGCSHGQRHSGCAAAQVEHVVSGMLVRGCSWVAEPAAALSAVHAATLLQPRPAARWACCRQCCQGVGREGLHNCCAVTASAVHVLVLGTARLDN